MSWELVLFLMMIHLWAFALLGFYVREAHDNAKLREENAALRVKLSRRHRDARRS